VNGIVTCYDNRRGFGFIKPLIGRPDAAPDIFFHASAVRGGISPPKGAEVSFLVVRGNRGPQAADVQLVQVKL
jgi:CspA family cold shock protein